MALVVELVDLMAEVSESAEDSVDPVFSVRPVLI